MGTFGRDRNLWSHSAVECDRPEVTFWVWVQFARAHKSADKCGGNSGWQPWVLGYNAYACSVCSIVHLAFVCTAHSYPQQVSSCSTARGRRKGQRPWLATEFLQTLQCVAFVTENCRTRESAVSKIYGPTGNGFSDDHGHAPSPRLPAAPSHLHLNPCGLLWLLRQRVSLSPN